VKIKETIKQEGEKGFFTRTVDRSSLWSIQTPQGFKFDTLYAAHRKARTSGFHGTDDASLLERLRGRVKIVEGDYDNVKITTKEDLAVAEVVLKRRRSR
jgi:2-C-methyl-D-erythritol 4-phosphate cytidylyltransferase